MLKLPRPEDRAGHRRDLAPAEAAQCLERVRGRLGVAGEPCGHHARLRRQRRVVEPGAAPGPVGCRAAEQRQRNRGRGGGVADPHLAHDQ